MLSNLYVKTSYQGNGSSTNFAIPFQNIVSDSAETLVYVRDETIPTAPVESLKVQGALQDYTLTGASPPTTPFNTTVVFNTAPTSSQKVVLYRLLPLTQLLTLLTSGVYDFSTITLALDRIVAMIQQLNEQSTRTPLLQRSTQSAQLVIPEPQASTVIGFDTNKALTLYPATTVPAVLELQVTVADNGAGQALTGFSVDAAVYRTLTIGYTLLRKSSNGTLREVGQLILTYDDTNSVWVISNPVEGGSGLCGVTFSVNTASGVGTIVFTSDSFSLGGSSYSGAIRFKTIIGFLKET